jgi:hypothetical protein
MVGPSFQFVVGIVHTVSNEYCTAVCMSVGSAEEQLVKLILLSASHTFNFLAPLLYGTYIQVTKEYASSHYTGLWTAPAISMLSSAMVRPYCLGD